jgi:hypothetical protein
MSDKEAKEKDQESDQEIADNSEAPEQQTPAPAAPVSSNSPSASQADITASTQAAMPPPPTQTQASAPNANTVNVIAPAQDIQQKIAEHAAVADDMNTGKITPETYASLYDKKDTLGKIGTLFGLLVSGAGSGLAHQSNAVMDMMNNTIRNDLEAQKQTQANRLSWYNAAINHEKQKNENLLTQAQVAAAQTGNVGTLTDLAVKLKQAKDSGVEDLDGEHTAYSGMLAGVNNSIYRNILKMPDGPVKAQAMAAYQNQVIPAINQAVASDAQEKIAKKNAVIALRNKPVAADVIPPVIDSAAYQKGVFRGGAQKQTMGRVTTADAIDPEDRNAIDTEIKDRSEKFKSKQQVVKAFNELSGMTNAGQIPGASSITGVGSALGALAGGAIGSLFTPAGTAIGASGGAGVGGAAGHALTGFLKEKFENKRNALVEAIAPILSMPGNATSEARHSAAEALVPNAYDDDETKKIKFRNLNNHFELQDNYPKMEKYHLKTPMPNYEYKPIIPDLPKEQKTESKSQKNKMWEK